MEVRNLLKDDDAVSPVIGVILMVAITVILAAVIATFVLGLGEQVSSTAPQASFTFDYDEGVNGEDSFQNDQSDGDGLLNITHAGGNTLAAENLAVSGAGGNGGDWIDADNEDYTEGSEITAGDGISVWIDSDETISVNWQSSDGSSSSTLRRWSGPDA